MLVEGMESGMEIWGIDKISYDIMTCLTSGVFFYSILIFFSHSSQHSLSPTVYTYIPSTGAAYLFFFLFLLRFSCIYINT